MSNKMFLFVYSRKCSVGVSDHFSASFFVPYFLRSDRETISGHAKDVFRRVQIVSHQDKESSAQKIASRPQSPRCSVQFMLDHIPDRSSFPCIAKKIAYLFSLIPDHENDLRDRARKRFEFPFDQIFSAHFLHGFVARLRKRKHPCPLSRSEYDRLDVLLRLHHVD